MNNQVVRLNNIVKNFKLGRQEIQVLKGIDLVINRGEFVSIMGPSGSGKSTLMSILGCLDSPTSGEYYLDNENVANFTDKKQADIRNRKIGFVFQTFNLLPRISAYHNVQLPLLYGKKRRDNHLPNEALETVGLAHRKKHKPNELSGGERQRVAIARAIVTNPAIIMADEPTGNLDSKTSYEIMQLFTELHKKGATIILVTHEHDIAQYSERIIGLKDGEIFKDEKI
jgi:putative ABC transport system ATP-binding protein